MIKKLSNKWENHKDKIINNTIYKSKDYKYFKKHMTILGRL